MGKREKFDPDHNKRCVCGHEQSVHYPRMYELGECGIKGCGCVSFHLAPPEPKPSPLPVNWTEPRLFEVK